MDTVEDFIDVNAPLSTVYNQWTQFEEFPRFMSGIEEVQRISDRRLRWRARIGGKIKEWEAEIYDQIPEQRIAWRSVSGAENSGKVTFEWIGSTRTRINLSLNYQPQDRAEKAAAALGVVSRRVTGDLRRFKEFIEARGFETGQWRRAMREGRVVASPEHAARSGKFEPTLDTRNRRE